MKRVTFHPQAVAELIEATEFYEDRSPGLGAALLDETERAIARIAAMPEASERIAPRARRKALWRFPYSIIYGICDDRVRVVAFAHQRRRPFYWRERLEDTSGSPEA